MKNHSDKFSTSALLTINSSVNIIFRFIQKFVNMDTNIIFWLSLIITLNCSIASQFYVLGNLANMKCTYGERGSLTATCVNATASYFKQTAYRFDQLDETLRCQNCNLSIIDAQTFDISGNQIKTLDIRECRIAAIRPKGFIGLIFMETLLLSHNEIHSIYPGSFTGVRKVKTIDLSHNKLEVLSEDGFLELANLQSLDLSGNLISSISARAFNGLNSLQVLNLGRNGIKQIASELENLTSLQVINLEFNHINQLTGNEFCNLTALIELNLAFNKIEAPIIYFNSSNNLVKLDLSNNNIKKLNSLSFYGLHALEDFDISFNSIAAIPQKTLLGMHNLRSLNVSNNKLEQFQTGLYTGLPQLRQLNFSNNVINEIEITGIFSLHNLDTLDISHNQLVELDYVALIARLPRISYLELQDNLLPCDLEKEMETYFGQDNFKFILYGNTVGSIKCVDVPSAKKRNFTVAAEQLVVNKAVEVAGSRSSEVIIFVLIAFIIGAIALLFYVQFRFYVEIKHSFSQNTRTISSVHLVTSEVDNEGNDFLRE